MGSKKSSWPWKRLKEALIVGSIVLAARSLDVLSTWLGDPGLHGEQNPFVKLYGAGWNFLIVTNVAVVGIAVLARWFSGGSLKWVPKGLGRGDFWSFLYWRERRPLGALLKATVPSRHGWWLLLRALPWQLAGASVLTSVGNIVGTTSFGAKIWANMISGPIPLVTTFLAFIVVSWVAWFELEYRTYRRNARHQAKVPQENSGTTRTPKVPETSREEPKRPKQRPKSTT